MIIEPNNCYNMDCAVGMRLMKEQGLKADWCITDPPYGIGIDGQIGGLIMLNLVSMKRKIGIIKELKKVFLI